ncbi:purine-nucleoside phosphorylase [Desulfococcus sp.]|uniref:purine-nucleoside phosphorylase n=1 Tax=Desulfococcus sp. TaxID=2025834 RepID=UPI0035946CB6
MSQYRQMVNNAVDFLEKRIGIRPRVGILTGTGLGESAGGLTVREAFDYSDIPHFPVSTVEGHRGRLLFGDSGGMPVTVMQGRIHLYEGYTPLQVTFPIRVMRRLGVTTLILSNAAGGFDPAFVPGDIMIITDHINLTGANALMGPNEADWGIRFPDMNHVYDPALRALAREAAGQCRIPLREGVYAGLTGPSLETPAEVRYLKIIGADAVGFSTVQEAIVAVHAGMRVLGLSIITNVNDPDRPVPATVEEIIAVANRAAPALERLIQTLLERVAAHG